MSNEAKESRLPFPKEWLRDLTDVSDGAIGYFMGDSVVNDSDDGLDDEQKRTAKKERHDVWLSALPEDLILSGAEETQTNLILHTQEAIKICTDKTGSSGTSLLSPELVKDLDKRAQSRSLKTFNKGVFLSFLSKFTESPRLVDLKDKINSGYGQLTQWTKTASVCLKDITDNLPEVIEQVTGILELGLGKDSSMARAIIVQDVVLAQIQMRFDKMKERLSGLSTHERDTTAESIAAYNTALIKVFGNTAAKRECAPADAKRTFQ